MAFIPIIKFDNEFEAMRLATQLEADNIPHRLRSYGDSAYDGIFQNQRGWGVLEARDDDREKILAIFADLQKAE
jgi:hypothetical protein